MKRRNPALVFICLVGATAIVGAQEPAPPPQPQYPPEQAFRQWDKDGNGKLTPDEVPRENLFRLLDKNGDGSVSKEEAATLGRGRAGAQPPVGGAGQRQQWRGVGVSEGAPLPPAENFKPRPHGDEANAAGLDPAVLAKLDVEMQRHVAAKNVAGIAALIHKDGERGYFETFGMADIEAGKPMPRDAIFQLQSMSKPVVVACALALYDEGRFTLDEPISKHLPEWTEPKVLENGELVPARNPITPRMLMSHSSGLYYGTIDGGPFTAGATGRGARTTLAEHSRSLAAKPLKFHPGEGYSYGTSIDVLGRYMEVVSGLPLDELLRQRLLAPLKMVDTDFWVPPEKAHRIAQIYSQPERGVLRRGRPASQLTTKPTLFMGGQGLCSTAADYERFCRMILDRGELDGVRVLKPETVDMMFDNQLAENARRFGLSAAGQKYGLGGAVDGEGGYAWGGANGTQFWMDRTNRLFGIFMVQTQRYRAPTYNDFRGLANQAAGIATTRGLGMLGQGNDGPDGRMGALFAQRDKNGDGKLDRDELPPTLFDRLDANKDGAVTEEELGMLWGARQ